MAKKSKKHHRHDRLEAGPSEEKPGLKLVLKVGSAEPVSESIIPDHLDSPSKKHKHKKKKKKHKHDRHERDGRHEKRDKDRDTQTKYEKDPDRHSRKEKRKHEAVEETTEEEPMIIEEPPAKKALFVPEETTSQVVRPVRERKPNENSALMECLNYLHRTLHRKDINGFFGFPVTDTIAPGYSAIIKQPMDFSTMKAKIDSGQYNSIADYKKDFKLMCDNCMTYNRPETIYYKEAKRLLSTAFKQLSKDKLLMMKKNLSFMVTLTNEDLGLDQDDVTDSDQLEGIDAAAALRKQQALAAKPKIPKPKPNKFEAIPDNLSAEEVLDQAQEAASAAADMLTLRKPDSKLGFLNRKEDGTITMNILNPDNDGIVSEKEKVVSLGALVGKLSSGAGNIAGFREDKRNKATPVTYLNYGPFSSYAPSYDSSFATLCKEDSDLLLSTYGDETGAQYAKSIKSFVEDAGDFAVKMADNLLDLLTAGQHSKTLAVLEEKQRLEEEQKKEDQKRKLAEELSEHQVREEALHLDDTSDGVDMSFLDNFARRLRRDDPASEEQRQIDGKLSEISQFIQDLQKIQHKRLSARPPPHLAHIVKPSAKETELAEKVTKALTELAKQANPGEVVSMEGLRAAMGITLDPVPGSQDMQQDSQQDTQQDTQQDSQVDLANMSSEDQPPDHDLDGDLQDFFDQGPSLHVCDSPTVDPHHQTAMDTASSLDSQLMTDSTLS